MQLSREVPRGLASDAAKIMNTRLPEATGGEPRAWRVVACTALDLLCPLPQSNLLVGEDMVRGEGGQGSGSWAPTGDQLQPDPKRCSPWGPAEPPKDATQPPAWWGPFATFSQTWPSRAKCCRVPQPSPPGQPGKWEGWVPKPDHSHCGHWRGPLGVGLEPTFTANPSRPCF